MAGLENSKIKNGRNAAAIFFVYLVLSVQIKFLIVRPGTFVP